MRGRRGKMKAGTPISSSIIPVVRYVPFLVIVVVNVVFAFNYDSVVAEAFLTANAAMFLTFGFFSIFIFRLWNIRIEGDRVFASRGKRCMEFSIHDIGNIEMDPNFVFRNGPPFVKMILQEKVDGIGEVRFLPPRNKLHEQLLLDPWKKWRIRKAQESLKRRGAKR
jgi:hypothetical protein